MAQVHVLDYDGRAFQCVIHTAVPTGNNAAGHSWQTVFLNAGKTGTTQLVEGTGPGQISTTEKASVLTGATMEFAVSVEGPVSLTGAQLQALLMELAPTVVSGQTELWQRQYKYYGATRG